MRWVSIRGRSPGPSKTTVSSRQGRGEQSRVNPPPSLSEYEHSKPSPPGVETTSPCPQCSIPSTGGSLDHANLVRAYDAPNGDLRTATETPDVSTTRSSTLVISLSRPITEDESSSTNLRQPLRLAWSTSSDQLKEIGISSSCIRQATRHRVPRSTFATPKYQSLVPTPNSWGRDQSSTSPFSLNSSGRPLSTRVYNSLHYLGS